MAGSPHRARRATPDLSFLVGGGDMGRRIRDYPWETTALGPPAAWRPTLKAMVRMALTTSHPIFIFWGPTHVCLYNDAYRASLGPEKHPSILGMPGRQAWDEVWTIIGPQIELVMAGEGATWHENQLVPILRRGSIEDVYWTYSYGPIDDPTAEHGVGGVLVICTETTQQVLTEQRLQRSDRLKNRFLATLSHELRNPLAPILTASHLLARHDLPAEHVVECGQLIQRQSRNMALLLDDLLELSRITTGKLELRRSRVDAKAIVEAAVEAVRPAIDAKAHVLEVSIPDGPVSFVADPLRLSQVLINLLANAAKYTDRGGRIALTVRRSEREVVFEVADNGIGLSAEMRPDLFEIFHQAKDTIDRSQGGLGIGLALSKGLVELHGGRIDAESEGHGRGSTFRVFIPLDAALPDVPAAIDAAVPVVRPPARQRRVLVVDDNRDITSTMGMVLEIEGYDFALAHDGVEALAVAESFRPEAAFLDIGMPRLDGYQVATRLRGTAWGRDMLLIATTGWGQQEDKQRALDAGFDLHLTKPVSPSELANLLAARMGAPGR